MANKELSEKEAYLLLIDDIFRDLSIAHGFSLYENRL